MLETEIESGYGVALWMCPDPHVGGRPSAPHDREGYEKHQYGGPRVNGYRSVTLRTVSSPAQHVFETLPTMLGSSGLRLESPNHASSARSVRIA